MENRRKVIPDFVIRRNKRLQEFFDSVDMPVRLVGDPNAPAIIYKEILCLSAYVHNFKLRFTDKPSNGELVKEYDLDNYSITRQEIVDLLDRCEQRRIYRLQYDEEIEMFVTGYNYLNKDDKKSMYPVFSKNNAKVYFSKEFAQEMVDKFIDEYDLCIV